MRQTILIVEDDRNLADALIETLELEGFNALHADDGRAALRVLGQAAVDLVVSDVHMRGMDGHALLQAIRQQRRDLPVLLMTAYGTIEKAVAAMKEGAAEYLVKPFEADALIDTLRRHLTDVSGDEAEPVAVAPASRQVLELVRRVARTDATVMIGGESGSGKEVLAAYIHRHSPRADGPFVAINCAAIPETMLEATLFGYEKGAFTGACKATPGKFELAQGGTLLLDEISEMDLALQAKLLRVLQEREVERLGGGRLIALDVRVLATSNRDLKTCVAAGRFREDLYYRLNVFPLCSPALRQRPEDIVPLAERFIARAARAAGRPVPGLSPAARSKLGGHPWPGNVRELDNVIQRALIIQPGAVIEADDLFLETTADGAAGQTRASPQAAAAAAPLPPAEPGAGDLKTREYQVILEALQSGSRQSAAARLGISPRTLRYKLARLREAGFFVP